MPSDIPIVERKPFRFSVQTPGPVDRRGWSEVARKAEDLGFSVLTVADHLDSGPAPIPALMAAADATTNLRIGTMVLANDYTHPVVVAKSAATLDLLSDGRLELGIGAGWMTTDYQHAGIQMDRASVRIERLTEAVTVIKAMFSGEPTDFDGKHYQLTGMVGSPLPVQRPHPPIIIGGGGRRILELAAREANIVGLNIALWSGRIDENAGPSATSAATADKLRWLHDAAPERFASLELQVRVHLAMIHDDRQSIAEAVGPALGLSPEEALASPHALVGSRSEVIDQCQRWREDFGISMFGLPADCMDDFAPVVAELIGS